MCTPTATALAEACWLGAVITLPLSVQLMAEGPYSDPKIALTRLYGVLMWACVAFALRGLWPRILQLKLPITFALGLLAVSSISQYFALDPTASTHHRDVASFSLPGLAPQIGLFLGVCLFLRTSEQLRRLGTAVVATSFAVALVALTESFGLANPDHGEKPLWSVVSFVGSGLSVGSYLAFCLPISVWWLWWQFKRSASRVNAPVLFGSLLVLVQLCSIFGANKRGPMVSLLVTAILAAILLPQKKATLSWTIRMSIVGLLVAGTLTALAFYGRSKPEFRNIPVLGKLSMVVPVGKGTGDSSRDRIWTAAADIFTRQIPVIRPDGKPDKFQGLRPWLGLGPDSAVLALASGYLMLGRWPSSALEMSTHNHLLDILLTLGVAGLLVHCALCISVFLCGWRHLFGRWSGRWAAWLVGLAATSSVAIVTSLIWGRGYFVMGIQAGMLASFALFALLGNTEVQPERREEPVEKLYIALLVAAAGYWTYLWFMFPTTEGLALFFISCGAIVGFAGTAPSPDKVSLEHRLPVSLPPTFVWFYYVSILILYSIVASRFSIFPILKGTVDAYVLFTASTANTFIVFCIMLIMWGTHAALLPNAEWSRHSVVRALGNTGIATIGILLFFLLLGAVARWTPLSWLADITAAQVLSVPLAAVLMVGAASYGQQCPRFLTRRTIFAATACLVSAAYFLAPVFNNLRAAMAAGYLRRFSLPYDHMLATRMCELAPRSMQYRQVRVQLLDSQFRRATPYSAGWLKLHDAKIRLLEEANRHSNFSLNSAHLGRMYLEKWEMTQCEVEREWFLQKAASSLRTSLNFMPQNEMALVDLAFVHSMRGDIEASEHCLEVADAVTSKSPVPFGEISYLRWWTYYYNLASKTHSKPRRIMYAQRALRYLMDHIRQLDGSIRASAKNSSINPRDIEDKGWLHSMRGDVWQMLDEPEKALKDFALSNYYWSFRPTPETIETSIRQLHDATTSRPSRNGPARQP